MQPKGKTMLKVVGILYIVFAAISIIGGLLLMLGGGIFAAGGVAAGEMLGAGMGGIVLIGGIILILSSILGLVTGILGVKYCARPEKAQTCFVLGIILIVFAAFNLLSAISGDSSVFSALVGLVLPVLYTLGAYWNKQSFLNQ